MGVLELFRNLVNGITLFVGFGTIFLGIMFFIDLVYLRRSRQFKEAFGKPPRKMTSEQVNNLILSKHKHLSEMKQKIERLSSGMEKDLLQAQIEINLETIRDMEIAAVVNNFVISKESRSALDQMNQLLIRHIAPAA